MEYDSDENKICEVLVVGGKLHGPGYIWDSEGRLLHKAEFKAGKQTGTSTIKTYDDDGKEVYVRKLWWDDVPRLTKEQVYRDGKILWEIQFDAASRPTIIKRWQTVKTKRVTDEEGNERKTPKRQMKCVELVEMSRSFRKLKMGDGGKNIVGLPKEKRTGFAKSTGEDEDGKKTYKLGADPPTYGKIKEYFADTPWEKALLEKMEALNLNDEDSPYEKDDPEESNQADPGGMGAGGGGGDGNP